MKISNIMDRGFTLIEAVMVIAITGVIAAVVAVFIRMPVDGYFASVRRAEMTDTADTALRRIARELRLSVPNSVRTSSNAIEFLMTRTGGRYRADLDNSGGGNVLDVTQNVATFDVLGPMNVVQGDLIVVANLGTGLNDAYTRTNVRTVTNVSGNTVTISPATAFGVGSPGNRFQVIDTPVSYICDSGKLWRYWGYTFGTTQSTTVAALNALVTPATASRGSALLADHVGSCLFQYEGAVTESSGLVSMRITLTDTGESVTLYHEVHVNNTP